MDRRRFLTVAGTLSTAALGGCIGGPGGQPTPTEAATPTDTATATATETPTSMTTPRSVGQREYPDYNWAVLEDAGSAFTTEITMADVAFSPLIAEVPAGTAVSFVNEDSFAHTVTIPALDIDERVDGGATIELTFAETGTFDYVCKLHPPSMLGRIIVTDETPGGTPTPTPTPTPTSDGGGGGGGYYRRPDRETD